MFLSGQMFENAAVNESVAVTNSQEPGEGTIMYHGVPVEVKDRLNRFRAVDDNIWNNPYRATSYKIRSFYHSKDQEFKQTHLTDNEIERIKKAQEEEYRKKLHTSARDEARDRINARKVER